MQQSQSELEKKIRWAIDNPKKSLSMADLNLEFFVNGVAIVDSPEINVPVYEFVDETSYNAHINLTVGIHNPMNKVLKPDAFHFALLLPEPLFTQSDIFRSVTQLPDKRHIYNAKPMSTLFPQGWDTLTVQLSTNGEHLTSNTAEIIIRLSTEFGSKDYLCILKFGERII